MFGRTDRAVPPVWWRLWGDRPAAVEPMVKRTAESGADWFVLPASCPLNALQQWGQALRAAAGSAAHVVVGVNSGDLHTKAMKPVYARLDALHGLRCEALILESLSLAEVKAGRPFHRFARLRDEGRVNYCIASSADDFAAAEWMVEHTPAHGILATFGLEDPTLKYRVLDAARELGTAIIARRPDGNTAVWNPPRPIAAGGSISFALSHPAVTAVVEDLPESEQSLRDCLTAATQPMDEPSAGEWWEAFQHEVAPPPKPRGGHPPEFGA